MAGFNSYTLKEKISYFIKQGKEGDCWDFKQEWHSDMGDLIKDIVCFVNTVHTEDCYLIFGISDNLQIVGMEKVRRKQAEILDAIAKIQFAGDVPAIDVKTIVMEEKEIDVLTIFNTNLTPVYLETRPYGKMKPGCIYTRTADRNTPDNSNARYNEIEQLWKKRLGLLKSPIEFAHDCLLLKHNWKENEAGFYYSYKPEFSIFERSDADERDMDEFYAFAMYNEKMSFHYIDIRYFQTVLKSYQIAVLDSGRLSVPVPEWGYLARNRHSMSAQIVYKYYLCDSNSYKLLQFLYDEEDEEERYAFERLKKVVVLYQNEEERRRFELYVEKNQNSLLNAIEEDTDYSYINASTPQETEVYKHRLRTGKVMVNTYNEWIRKGKLD